MGQEAMKRPLTKETLMKQIGRLGTSIFTLRELKAEISGHVMVPVSELNEVRRLIQMGALDQAEARLDGIPQHNAEWYFLRGVVAQRRGWMDEAAQNFRIAVNMDPNNMEYRSALNSIRGGGNTYRQVQYNDATDDLCGCCSSLMCLNCLCGGCR